MQCQATFESVPVASPVAPAVPAAHAYNPAFPAAAEVSAGSPAVFGGLRVAAAAALGPWLLLRLVL